MKKAGIFCIALFFLIPLLSISDDLTWTGGSGDNKWHNPANWTGGKVPTATDNVTIPSGTPECKVNIGKVNNLVNNGTLSGTNGNSIWIDAEGTFSNNGTVGGDYYRTRIDANSIINNPSATITGEQDQSNAHAIDLYARHDVTNLGDITGIKGSQSSGFLGAEINIMTSGTDGNSKVTNHGNINAGDGGGGVGDGGSITIETQTLKNTGHIISGNGTDTDSKDGYIKIAAVKKENTGTIKGGKSQSQTRFDLDGRILYQGSIVMGDVDIFADSIILAPGSNYIEGKALSFYCNYLEISDLEYLGSIWCTEGIHIYVTPSGTADFSGVSRFQGLFSEYNVANEIYANNIIEPAEGLDYIFRPAPDIYPSDETITGGGVTGFDEINYPGESANVLFNIQNQSMVPKTIDYVVTSQLGWVSTFNSTTPTIDPFEFIGMNFQYSIPDGTPAGTSDTVEMAISIDGNLADTAFCVIMCIESPFVGIPENNATRLGVLYQNHPNPFSQSTTIAYELNEPAYISLEVYDLNGKIVCTPLNAFTGKGKHECIINDKKLKNGVYFYVLKSDGRIIASQRMVVVK